MMKVAEEEKKKKTRTKKGCGHPSQASGKSGDLSRAVAGFIESGTFTVRGGLIFSWSDLHGGSHCVFRTSCKHVIVIVNSEHCKWCKDSSFTPVQDSDFDEVRTRAYLQGVFQLKLAETVKLSELISELTQTNGHRRTFPFTCTPPYCTVENVTHISSLALQKLIEVDKDFVWGDNLIFNIKGEFPGSSSH